MRHIDNMLEAFIARAIVKLISEIFCECGDDA
jgi:hypothetical protein